MLQPIERAIIESNIGINPQNDGNMIRMFLPPLTEERRKELVKREMVKVNNLKLPCAIFAATQLNQKNAKKWPE